jgi:hypothetical protein
VLKEVDRSILDGGDERRRGRGAGQSRGRKTSVGKLTGGGGSLEAGEEEAEFEVGVVKCVLNAGLGSGEGGKECVKMRRNERWGSDGGTKNLESIQVDEAGAEGVSNRVELLEKGRGEVREGKGTCGGKKKTTFVFVKEEAQGGAMFFKKVENEGQVNQPNDAVAIVHIRGGEGRGDRSGQGVRPFLEGLV